ncbi:gluconate 5-dehydrogenase [Acrasis kona]|uniref:3-oxoacyl-[acyl-carrier-protein] reductase n=1 Tax=Acrasis kona TaxID=1008807 RepID=A0AAW2ZLX4_9EUKA
MQLEGKIALVTGAGKGIGRAIAIGMAEQGADVAILSRTRQDLEDVAKEIINLGRKAYIVTADVSKVSDIEEAVRDVQSQTNRIDILVNNAGMNIRTPAIDVTEEDWNKIMDTNLKSAFFLSREVARIMKEQNTGRIINISSVAGCVAIRTGVVYGAAKAGMIHMTKILAMEFAKYGINVNGIGPWYFKTPLTEKVLSNKEYLDEVISRTPMGRVGELKELVGPAVFLASDSSSYITGQTL